MKPRRTWLETALRAAVAKTADRRRHLQSATQASTEAASARGIAQREERSFAGAWAEGRRGSGLDAPLDLAYRRFHEHLLGVSRAADEAHEDCLEAQGEATASLRQSHAAEQLLTRVADRRRALQAEESRRHEHRNNEELWLLARYRKEDGE